VTTNAPATPDPRRDRIKKRPFTFWADESLKRQVKRAIVDLDITMTDFFVNATINELKRLSSSDPE
jgi:hypothetical protein